jgi:hypothetical protein
MEANWQPVAATLMIATDSGGDIHIPHVAVGEGVLGAREAEPPGMPPGTDDEAVAPDLSLRSPGTAVFEPNGVRVRETDITRPVDDLDPHRLQPIPETFPVVYLLLEPPGREEHPG